ncbi:hypothetical protein BC832DRAFT_594509 [Gaertneriomyces semiglobifer]|nr:hypothetical protein BC832DRAFT_594509 [Gaertneriomyces semiglobifer]
MADKKPLARLASQQVLLMTGKGTKEDTAISRRIATNGYTDKDLLWEMVEFVKVEDKVNAELASSARALNDRIALHNFRLDNIPTDEFIEMYVSDDGFKKFTDRYHHPGVVHKLGNMYGLKNLIRNSGYSQFPQGAPGNSGGYHTPSQRPLLPDPINSGSYNTVQPRALLPPPVEGASTVEIPTSPVSPDSTSSTPSTPQSARRRSENDAGQPPAKRRQTKCGNCNKEGHRKNRCEDPCSKCNQKHPGKPCPPSEMNQASASTDAE